MQGAFGSLTARLLLVAGLFAALLLIAMGFGSSQMYRASVMRDVDDRLDGDLRALVNSAERLEGNEGLSLREPGDPRYGQTFSGRYWVVLSQGADGWQEIARSASLYDESLRPAAEEIREVIALQGAVVSLTGVGPTDEPLYIRARAVALGEAAEPLVFMAAVNERPIREDVRSFATAVALFILALAALLIITVFFQVRWGLAPLNRLRAEINDIQSGRRRQLSGQVPREVEPLADALNGLIANNRESVERARDRAGNLAHGLKTPLTVMRNALAQEQDPARRDLFDAQLTSMGDIIERHLRTARASATARTPDARTELAPAVARLTGTLRKMYPDRDLIIDTIGLTGAVQVAPHDLDDILGNLLDNAMKWASNRIEITATRSDRRWVLHIDDDGQGLDEQSRRDVLQRGRRLDEDMAGSGLGLAIVKELVEAYDGRFSLAASPLGGLRAEIVLRADTLSAVQ